MRVCFRSLLALVACVVAAPLPYFSQQPGKVWRVGVLVARARADPPQSDWLVQLSGFLADLGYVEGKNFALEWRFADGDYERLNRLASELALLPVDVILTADGTPSAVAAFEATRTIPIVFVNVGDPVAVGLVKNLAHPGGNITGIALISNDMVGKQMEMVSSLIPDRVRVAVLTNPANPNSLFMLKSLRAAALQVRREVVVVEARTAAEIADAFAVVRRERAGALVVMPETFLFQQRARIAEGAAALRLPSMGAMREYAEAGGLMAYGPNRTETLRRAVTYVDKILRGAKPADLPVEMPTRVELVINQKTAKALGLKIPPELLVLADKVIE